MAIQASRPNNRIFLILGVVLAALAFGGVLFAVRQANGNTTSIVVAKMTLSAGTTITADDLTTAAVPQSVAPPDAYTNPTEVVSKTLSASVSPNTPMTPALFQTAAFSAPSGASSGNSASNGPVSVEPQLTKGFVAMAIPASAAVPSGLNLSSAQQNNLSGELVSAGFYIQPGDHIDIIIDTVNGTTVGARYAFQDVPVLRTGSAGGAANASPTMYLVEVSRNQAELLSTLIVNPSHEFTIRYVLRPQSEWGKFANNTYTPNYEPSTGPAVPGVADKTVTQADLDSAFGH